MTPKPDPEALTGILRKQQNRILVALVEFGPQNLEQLQDSLDWYGGGRDWVIDRTWWDDETLTERLQELLLSKKIGVDESLLTPKFFALQQGVPVEPDWRPAMVLAHMDPLDLREMMRWAVLAVLERSQGSQSEQCIFLELRKEAGQLGELITMSHIRNVLASCRTSDEAASRAIGPAVNQWRLTPGTNVYQWE